MRRGWGCFLGAVTGATLACRPAAFVRDAGLPPPAAPVTAIVGVTVIDGTGAAPRPSTTVLLQGRRIQAIGPQGKVRVPPGAEVIDGRGLFVLPGFIDVNVHFASFYPPQQSGLEAREALKAALQHAANTLPYGVTTVRDSYGSLRILRAVRDSIRAGRLLGPRLLIAGNIVGWGGHGSTTFERSPARLGAPLPQWAVAMIPFQPLFTEGAGEDLIGLDVDSLRVRINQYLDKGVDFLKYGATTHGSGLMLFSGRAQRVIVEEVHKRGLIAETHATAPEALRLAVLAGVDLVQHAENNMHGRWLGSDAWPDDLVQLLVERRVICALTPSSNIASTAVNRRKLIRAGCTIAVSTDGYSGLETLQAIEALVPQGMTPMQAIVAATRNGALASQMLDQIGTVEVGKLADLVVLRADPLQDIKHIEQIALVFAEGVRVPPAPAAPAAGR